jgi:hypothetical protein
MSWMQGSSSSSAYSSSRRPTTAPGSASSTEDFPMRKKKKSEPKETDAEIRAQTASGGTSKPLTVFSVPASTCPARTPATSVVVQPEGEEACLEDCEVCGNWTCNEDMLGHAGLHLCQGCQRHAGYAPGTRLRFAADDGLRSWRKQRLPRPDDEEEEAQAPGVLTARPAPPPNQAWEEAMSVVFAECRTAEEARHLCKALAVHYHPDKGGSEQRFRLLQEICGRAERAAEEQQEAEADASSLMQGLQQPGQEDPTSRNEAEEDTSSFMQQPGSESEPDSEASNSWDPLAALEARRLWRKWRRGDWEWLERPGFEGSWRLKHPNRCNFEGEETSLMQRPPTCRLCGQPHHGAMRYLSHGGFSASEGWICEPCRPAFMREGAELAATARAQASAALLEFPVCASESCHRLCTWRDRLWNWWSQTHCCLQCAQGVFNLEATHGPWCEGFDPMVEVEGPVSDLGPC